MIGPLLAALLSTAQAQQAQVVLDRFGGLNDVDAPATIGQSEAQDALNVESNLEGTAILKRRGFTREAALTVSTGPVNGSHTMTCDNGDQLTIVCHDRYCSKSTNGGAFSNWLSTAGAKGATAVPTRWSFVDVDGDLYGANDSRDPVLKYDCTTLSYPINYPAGSLLALTEDRLVIADTSANPNRINYSKSGDFATFTTGSNSVDAFTDDLGAPGDKVTALKYDRGRLYPFKRTSITTCQVGDQYTQRCFPVSSNIGTQDPQSIVSAPDGLYFRSQDRTYWRLSEGGLELLSQKIGNYVKNQAAGVSRSNTQTTQSDWEAGSQSPASSYNTATRAGSILNSSNTFVDTTSADFAQGTSIGVSSTDVSGSLTLSSTVVQDNFSDGNYTANPVWTVTQGAWAASAANGLGPTGSNDNNTINTPSTISSGVWRFDYLFAATAGGEACSGGSTGDTCFEYRFSKNASNDYYALRILDDAFNPTKKVQLIKSISASITVLTSFTGNILESTNYQFSIQRGTDGVTALYIDDVYKSSFTDTDITSAAKIEIFQHRSASSPDIVRFKNIYSYMYLSSGTFLSRIFDTALSTPIAGPLSSTFTYRAEAYGAIFGIRTSTSPNNDMWTTFTASSDTLRIDLPRRYWQYRVNLFTRTTNTVVLAETSLSVTSTGTYRTQCIQPGTNINTWGILSCSQSNLGAGSLVFYATSAVSCATLPSNEPFNWQTSVTNNATISISTNAALYIGWRDLLNSATDQAQVDACTVYWNEGTLAQPSWGTYDSIKNAIYWTGTSTSSTQGDRLLKYDLNLRQFYPFSLQATALSIVNNSLYFGSSTGGYWNKYGADGINSDNGSAINAYWKSKDFGGASPFLETSFKTLSLVARNQVTGSMTATHALSNGVTGSHTVSLSTSAALGYIRDNYNLPLSSPANFMNVKLGSNSSTPFEVLGIRLEMYSQPWKAQNP